MDLGGGSKNETRETRLEAVTACRWEITVAEIGGKQCPGEKQTYPEGG